MTSYFVLIVIKFISTRIWLRFAVLLKSDLEVQQTGLETFSRLLLALLPFLKGEVKAMLPSAITDIYKYLSILLCHKTAAKFAACSNGIFVNTLDYVCPIFSPVSDI